MEQNEEDLQNSKNAVVSEPKQRRKTLIVRAIVIVCALLFSVAAFFTGYAVGGTSLDEQEKSLLWMLDTVQKNYREEVTREELLDRMYDALELDKFCTHYTPEELSEAVDERDGHNGGYGFSVRAEEGGVRVSRVIQNSPAALVGLAKGMYVYSCAGEKVETTSDVTSLLAAAEGETSVICGFSADGSDARELRFSRAEYLGSYCIYADREATFCFRGETGLVLTETGAGIPGLPENAAYLALIEFEGNADREFAVCLQKMKERGKTDLILDLRGNGGGYLTILCNIAAHLLRDAKGGSPLVAQAVVRSGDAYGYYADGNDFSSYFDSDSRVYVLADESSASASEALIGALIDYGTCDFSDIYVRKGTGEARTYGKGVMQTRYTAPDRNAMVLTVADIYWPKGRCIHGTGIGEKDGAIPVPAPALPGKTDEFLEIVLGMIA